MVALNLNRGYLGDDGLFFLSCYIATFSGLTLFYLGNLAKQHLDSSNLEAQQPASPTQSKTIVDVFGEPYNAPMQVPSIGFQLNGNIPKQGKGGRPPLTPEKIAEIKAYLANGYSMRQTAKACEVSLHTVTEVKNASKQA